MHTIKAVPKIIPDSVNEERVILNFPKAYRDDFTPYVKHDFSVETKNKCMLIKPNDVINDFRIYKVIFLGDVSVGKTCLVNRFCYKIFDSHYRATIGVDFEVEKFKILNVPFTLQLWDTAGQERFRSIAQSYYRSAKAIVVVFDFSDFASLDNCKRWLKDALTSYTTDPFIFLVGTKKDAISQQAFENIENIAADFAKSMKAEFWPVSSKSGENVEDLFYRIATLVFDDLIAKESDFILPSVKPIGTELIALKKKKRGEKFVKLRSNCNTRCNTS